MGLLLGTNAHMGHKYLHKHTMQTFTFGLTHTHQCTRAGTHTYSHTHKKNEGETAVASENNHNYQRKGILSYLSNTYLESFH